jgi:cyclophilin family peptidyl-prolyl cis-trans isomerase/protein-disulfide isomerase
MWKRIFFTFILVVGLAGCSSKASTPITPTPTIEAFLPEIPTQEPSCRPAQAQPTPQPDEQSLFAPVGANDWTRGPSSATVTIIEYADFQCPGCAMLSTILKDLRAAYPEDLQVVYRHFPLESANDKAVIAAQAAEAAGKQGKFWEMHDMLYETQAAWTDLAPADFEQWVKARAANLGLDIQTFSADLHSPGVENKIKSAEETGNQIGLPGIPLLVVNGQIQMPPYNYGALSDTVSLIALGKRQYSSCPPVTINSNKQYLATLQTQLGNVVIQLFADKAPLAVNNFVFLAKEGWFDNITFHRVIPDFVAQTGDPSGSGLGGPGYLFKDEIDPSLKFDKPGVVAMANNGPNSNGSQFFITYGPAPDLNGKYTIFGQVIDGMEILKRLTPRDPSVASSLPPGDALLSVTITEK